MPGPAPTVSLTPRQRELLETLTRSVGQTERLRPRYRYRYRYRLVAACLTTFGVTRRPR